jgi:hypothetical protein
MRHEHELSATETLAAMARRKLALPYEAADAQARFGAAVAFIPCQTTVT